MGYQKMVLYGNTLEVYDYEKNLSREQQGIRVHARRNGMSVLASDRTAQVFCRERRQDNARRARVVFIRLVESNVIGAMRPLLITFTYAENMQDLRRGYKDFQAFNKAFRYKFGKGFSYIAVPEFQKRGAVHFHALYWGLPSEVFGNERSTRLVAGIWGHGFVYMKTTDGSPKLAEYLGKYMSKSYLDKRIENMKAFVCSRNVKRPLEQQISNLYDIEADYELSTETACKIVQYHTQWLGACRKRIYKLPIIDS